MLQQWTGKKLVGVNGTALSVKGCVHVPVSIGGTEFEGTFAVLEDLVVDAILGLDFFQKHNCIIDSGEKLLRFPVVNLSVGLHDLREVTAKNTDKHAKSVGLVTTQKILIPPESETELMVRATGSVTEGIWMVENNPVLFHGVMVARALVCPSNGLVPIRVINPRNCSLPLKKGVELAKMELVEQDCILNVSAISKEKHKQVLPVDQETLWSLVSKAEDHLNLQEKEQLLLEYADVFPFKSSDLGRTSVLQHKINTGNENPVHVPPRRIPQAR